jgi:hypothetical protein
VKNSLLGNQEAMMLRQQKSLSIEHVFSICRKAGYCLLFIVLLFHGCSPETGSMSRIESIGAPKLVVKNGSYDFGNIKSGSTNTAIFNFTNVGDRPLKITNVKKCCGAVVKLDKEELNPGESGTLTAQYRAGPTSSLLNRKIGLFTNDLKNPQVELIITGKVVQTFQWTPRRFEISAYKENVKCPEITITSLDGTLFSIKGFAATGHCLTADFDPSFKAKEFTLKPVLDMAKLEALPVTAGQIKIDLDHQDHEVIYLGFEMTLPFEISPRAIFSMKTPIDKPVHRTVKLQDNRNKPSEDISSLIESFTSEKGSRIEVLDLNKVENGCEIKLEIWPGKDALAGSHWLDKLNIKLKGGHELNVPIYIFYETVKVPEVASSS